MPAIGSSSRRRGFQRQRHRDLQLAALAMRQVGGGHAFAPLQPGVGDMGARGVGQRAVAQRGAEEAEDAPAGALHGHHHVLQHREFGQDRRDLKGARKAEAGAARGVERADVLPANRISPASWRYSPTIWRIRVDLPAPFGPIRAWISPGNSVSDTSSEAFSAPKALGDVADVEDRVSHGAAFRPAGPTIPPRANRTTPAAAGPEAPSSIR
jgi:hypothetical protein